MLQSLESIMQAVENKTVVTCMYNDRIRTGVVIDGGITQTGKNKGQLFAKLEISDDGPEIKQRTINPANATWIKEV